MNNPILADCPCCGGRAKFGCDAGPMVEFDFETFETVPCKYEEYYSEWVECTECGLAILYCFEEGEAVEKWNRRSYAPIPFSTYTPTENEEFVLYGKKGGTSIASYIQLDGNYDVFCYKNSKSGSLYVPRKENSEDFYVVPLKKVTKEMVRELNKGQEDG